MKTMDLLMFEKHVDEFEFQNGIEQGMWGFHLEDPTSTWPLVIIWIQASTTYCAPGRCYLRYKLDSYPQSAPTACPWDIKTDGTLVDADWPKGYLNLNQVFRPGWNRTALYTPFDRVPITDGNHLGWQTQYPEYWWQSSFKITDYLVYLHRLLNT